MADASGDPRMSWENTFTSWSQGPSKTEQEKCENAERAIRRAITKSGELSVLPIKVFTQGSYANRTNVRQDSDVDVCVCLQDTFFYELPSSGSGNPADYGIVPAAMTIERFKGLVGKALIDEFGREGVTPGNKAFDVHENTYRIDADVIAAFEHRRYTGFDSFGRPLFISGIELRPDSGGRIINWPQQNYDNGVAKHSRTSRAYKRAIRILKHLRNAMQKDGVVVASDIASFLIECLVWNTPDAEFGRASYSEIVRAVLIHTFNSTQSQDRCNDWGEVNELKYLFRDGIQPWTRQQANQFLAGVWDYVGYK